MNQDTYTEVDYLKPHTYPFYIQLGIMIISGLFGYSLSQFPKYYEAAIYYKKGESLSSSGNEVGAVQLYQKALRITPTAEKVKFAIAYSIFKEPRYQDKFKALGYLQGINLNKSQWEKLKNVMPEDFSQYFETKKR